MNSAVTVKTATLRANLSQVFDTLSRKEDFMIVTRKGNPTCAIVNLDFFEDLLAKSSPHYLREIREARREYKRGNFLTHAQLFGELK